MSAISVTVQPWRRRPLSEVLFDSPGLAACLSLRPGTVEELAAPPVDLDRVRLEAAIVRQFSGLQGIGTASALEVVLASQAVKDPTAVAHGNTVLLIVPRDEPTTPAALAGSVASAVLLSRMRSAAPDPKVGEPLLVLAEGLVRAGLFSLATLPPELRPVRDWIDVKDARAALAALVDAALDQEKPWSRRRAGLIRLGEPGGVEPALAHAAALLVEACGREVALSGRPYDLLLAWQRSDDKGVPPIPGALRRAIEHPLEAGLPREKEKAERELIATEAFERRIAAGEVVTADSTWPLRRRIEAAAWARARGGDGVCDFLPIDALAPGVRTGCRDGEANGVVIARPLPDSSTEIVWVTSQGQAVPLLFWPRLALWPVIAAGTEDLFLVDAHGVWRIALDGSAVPVKVAAGDFRTLAVAQGGGSFAVVRAGDGRVVVGNADRLREVDGEGFRAVAWVTADILAVATARGIRLVARDQVAPGPPLECATSLAVLNPGALVAGVGCPSSAAGLRRVDLATGGVEVLATLAEPPAGLATLPGGGVAMGAWKGVFQWQPGNPSTRLAAGLTPGPG